MASALKKLLRAGQLGGPRSYFGVNITGTEYPTNSSAYGWPTLVQLRYLRSFGITLIRLPIAWENFQTTLSGALDTTQVNNLRQLLAWCNALGIKVIVDLHNFAHYSDAAHWGSGVSYAGNAGAAGAGVSAFGDGTLTTVVFADFWTKLTTAIAGAPALFGYGLMNEPINISSPTNLIFAPNGFADGIGSQPWVVLNGCVATQLAAGTNPLSATHSPAWTLTSGAGGFGAMKQDITLTAQKYTLSVYAWVDVSTDIIVLNIGSENSGNLAINTTPTRKTFTLASNASAGSNQVYLGPVEAAGHTIKVANAQLEAGTSATAYVASPYIAYAQAGIDAIRAVDLAKPIFVSGYNGSNAYRWIWENWDLATLTGGNLVFEAHQYFDGAITQGGGGGTYSGNYASYSFADDTAGAQMVAPFVTWVATTGLQGFLGEFGVPNTTADALSWTPLMRKAQAALQAGGIRGTYWQFGTFSTQDTGKLSINPAANSNHIALQMAAIAGFR